MNAYNILMRVAAASTTAEARDAYLKDAEWLLLDMANAVSYTHLDVYKRQVQGVGAEGFC